MNNKEEKWKEIGEVHIEFNNDNTIIKYINGYRITMHFHLYSEVSGCVDVQLERLDMEDDPRI